MISRLPEHLLERARLVSGPSVADDDVAGDFVLYWMRTAMRVDENPALDVARWLADRHGLPLLVYQAISEHYRYASDRHHTFMLQGARDVQARLRAMNLCHVFHLATPDDDRPHLVHLAERAAVVITEDMPVDPPRRFSRALAGKTRTPMVAVDTACVVPMQLVLKAFTRAYRYRNATKKLYAERVTRPWPESSLSVGTLHPAGLPFASLDLQSADLDELVARCRIDHAVGPVVDTVGGSTAGYQRWKNFRDNGLRSYARRRNDALVDGVSRMSPYLHYGMVSPLRIAREAAEPDHRGSQKFLDELLIWRELAYAFCFHREDHDQWSALPEWARATLQARAADPRPAIYSWEELARGQTADALWNAAQLSLLRQGELHNNVRMTWGKAILNWTASPQQALQRIIDLNHRYALDGRDPASYGGILWCLGQFDRPFPPEQPVLGTVRPRPTGQHAKRLDQERYGKRVSAVRYDRVPQVAVIGAGMSGLFAARTLADHGLPVTVFEKSRGVGGRMATRRADEGVSFDHGAQYFTVRDERFRRYVDSWQQQGLVARWPDPQAGPGQRIVVLKDGQLVSESESTARFVGLPAMNAVGKHLAADLPIRLKTRIAEILPANDELELVDDQGQSCGRFQRLVVSAPAGQTAELLTHFPALAAAAGSCRMDPCWAAMATFPQALTDQWVGAFLHDSFLVWTARNQTKPGRRDHVEQLVIHAGPQWTADHRDCKADDVAASMLEEFWRVTGIAAQQPATLQGHRWKYAIPLDQPEAACLFDRKAGVAACGDWCSGSRVEGAFLSGMAAAGRILGTLTGPACSPQAARPRFERVSEA
jgi:photolyase PhrII